MLHLLLHAVVLCFAASQTTNNTAGINQTFNVLTDHNTTDPNDTFSLNQVEEIEEELSGNHTFTIITEDDERFQNQRKTFTHCNKTLLLMYSDFICGQTFHAEMDAIGEEKWCDHAYFIRPYNDLTVCLENLADLIGCQYPGPDIQDYFLYCHSIYFQTCITEDHYQHEDAPSSVVTVLTVIPVSIIPVLVGLVVWKNSIEN